MEDEPIKCPSCSSDNIAEILWGMSAFSDELQEELAAGKIVLGGCCISVGDPKYECNECGHRFGKSDLVEETAELMQKRKLKAIVYGAAIGDALGVPYEFMARDTFKCNDMVGGGVHKMPAGTFSDDTSLLLATCDSIRKCGGIDVENMRERFKTWLDKGAYTVDGHAFDVGNTTATALKQGFGCNDERSNGNGSLMRIAPLALTDATDDEIRAISAITHAHPISTEACVFFVHVLRDVLAGKWIEDAIEQNIPDDKRFTFLK